MISSSIIVVIIIRIMSSIILVVIITWVGDSLSIIIIIIITRIISPAAGVRFWQHRSDMLGDAVPESLNRWLKRTPGGAI